MDLRYGPEYERFREEVRAFLAASWPPAGQEALRPLEEQERRFRRRAIERGFLARSVPRRYGGSEQPADPLRGTIVAEEFERAGAPGELRGTGPSMLVPTLLEHGAEWQKREFVAPTIRGEMRWCQGYSEPGSGSDLASLQTRGELRGESWLIHGQKIWTSGAHVADYMFCLVRTEPDAERHAGISYLLVDMKSPGVRVRPLRHMLGHSDFNEVFLDGVRVPARNIVGRRGEGWRVSRTTLAHERNMIGDATQTARLFRGLVGLARRCRRGGRPAVADPHVRQELARIHGYVLSHVYSGYRQLSCAARGRDPGTVSLMNKLVSTRISDRMARLALDLLGDEGMLAPREPGARMMSGLDTNPGWVIQYVWSLGAAIAGGTANIQRNVIAERGYGLPRDAVARSSPRKARRSSLPAALRGRGSGRSSHSDGTL